MNVDVQVFGDKHAARDLAEVGLKAADVLPVWPVLQGLFHEDMRRRFAAEGPGWKPLTDETLARKLSEGYPPAILRSTDTLYRSLTQMATGAEASTPWSLKFGTDVDYARFHQYGTRNMPKRVLIKLGYETRRKMVRVLERYITEGFGR